MTRPAVSSAAGSLKGRIQEMLPELAQGIDNLRTRKLRSLLTMLGMIFGVGAVVAMLSIGAGAQQEVIAFIEQLGVRNVIVEAREAPDGPTLEKVRALSAGLTLADLRDIQANVARLAATSAAQARDAGQDAAAAAGRDADGVRRRADLRRRSPGCASRRAGSSTPGDGDAGAVAVLGQAAAASLFGAEEPVGRYVKVNQQWFRVIGVAGPQLAAQADVAGLPGAGPEQRHLRAAAAARSCGSRTRRASARTRSTAST